MTTISNHRDIQGATTNRSEAVMGQIQGLAEGIKADAAAIQALIAELQALEPPTPKAVPKDASAETRAAIEKQNADAMTAYENKVTTLTQNIETLVGQMEEKQKKMNSLQNDKLPAARQEDMKAANRAAEEVKQQYETVASSLDNSQTDRLDENGQVVRSEIRAMELRRADTGETYTHVEVTPTFTPPSTNDAVFTGASTTRTPPPGSGIPI